MGSCSNKLNFRLSFSICEQTWQGVDKELPSFETLQHCRKDRSRAILSRFPKIWDQSILLHKIALYEVCAWRQFEVKMEVR